MLRQFVRPSLAVLAAAALAATTAGTADGTGGQAGSHAGPPYNFTTQLTGQFGTPPLKDQAMLTRTALGFRYWTGQQDSHLVVTRVSNGLRFVDTGTKSFKKRSPVCNRQHVRRGIAAVCKVPGAAISERAPLLIEVWPRLGNDYTNTAALPATFAVTVLGDKGHDVARFGAGPDFFNGFSSRDVVRGGGGNDWLRPGVGNDLVIGGPGRDDIVATEGRDTIRGGTGHDRLWGGDGGDRLGGGAGVDFVMCGNGRDRAKAGAGDRVARNCESVH